MNNPIIGFSMINKLPKTITSAIARCLLSRDEASEERSK